MLIKTLVFIALSAAPAHCQGVGSVTTPTAPAGQSATSAVNGSAAAPPPYHAIPSQAFLDHYASVISSAHTSLLVTMHATCTACHAASTALTLLKLPPATITPRARAGTVLVKNHKDAAAAAADAQLIFATAQRYAAAITAALPGLPKGNILYSLATSQLYTMVDQFLTAVAAPLPDQVKLDRFASNLTLSVLPGLTTALTGFSYSPCLLDVAGLGAIAGVQGIGISPKFFNTGVRPPPCAAAAGVAPAWERGAAACMPSVQCACQPA